MGSSPTVGKSWITGASNGEAIAGSCALPKPRGSWFQANQPLLKSIYYGFACSGSFASKIGGAILSDRVEDVSPLSDEKWDDSGRAGYGTPIHMRSAHKAYCGGTKRN
ncbi:hypothetical protein vBSenS3_115 [Salmonella phage vB_SenS-3]|nr:hypothetical protein vBSenS3_115 [Salmonella phage vB_SenS-3]